MEQCIRISNINDFLYSPQSLYLHGVYESFAQQAYKADPQIRGTLLHEPIEKGVYATGKRYLQGMPVYSEMHGIVGKIDLYDTKSKTLIERKTRIQHIHEGYRMQLYAQKICMEEGGYTVDALKLHSLIDNKRYDIPLPDEKEIARFESIISAMRNYNPVREKEGLREHARCNESIYNSLSF
jgi:CRISPR-associated exonuclease Cas4